MRQTYDQLVEQGKLKGGDKYQLEVIKELDRLKVQIENYIPEFHKSSSSFTLSSLWNREKQQKIVTNAPKGVYIFGSVGGGKSMLMDLFFECTELKEKKRVHFHDFMQTFHKRKNIRRVYNVEF